MATEARRCYTDDDRALVDQLARDLSFLETALRSPNYTVQVMPDPPRYEIIRAGKPPFYNDPECGTLERTIYVSPRSPLGAIDQEEKTDD